MHETAFRKPQKQIFTIWISPLQCLNLAPIGPIGLNVEVFRSVYSKQNIQMIFCAIVLSIKRILFPNNKKFNMFGLGEILPDYYHYNLLEQEHSTL